MKSVLSKLFKKEDDPKIDLCLKKINRFGFNKICSMAYDPVLRLLALASSETIILITKKYSECYFDIQNVKFMQFKVGKALLFCVSDDRLIRLNLTKAEIEFAVEFETVCCFHFPVGTDFMLVGTENGKVLIVDYRTGNAVEIFKVEKPCFLLLNPQIPSLLLIGCKNEVILFELNRKSVDRKYNLNVPPDVSILCGSWKPDGGNFIVGFSNGQYSIFSRKSENPVITINSNDSTDPIKRIQWLMFLEEKESLIVFSSLSTVECINLTNDFKSVKSKTGISLQSCEQLLVVPSSNPWANQQLDPAGLFTINDGVFHAFKFDNNGFVNLQLFPILKFCNTEIKDYKFYSGLDLNEFVNRTGESIGMFLSEDEESVDDDLSDLLITLDDNRLLFWSIGTKFKELERLNESFRTIDEMAKIVYFEFFPEDTFILAYNNGTILCFRSSYLEEKIEYNDEDLSISSLDHKEQYYKPVLMIRFKKVDSFISCLEYNKESQILAISANIFCLISFEKGLVIKLNEECFCKVSLLKVFEDLLILTATSLGKVKCLKVNLNEAKLCSRDVLFVAEPLNVLLIDVLQIPKEQKNYFKLSQEILNEVNNKDNFRNYTVVCHSNGVFVFKNFIKKYSEIKFLEAVDVAKVVHYNGYYLLFTVTEGKNKLMIYMLPKLKPIFEEVLLNRFSDFKKTITSDGRLIFVKGSEIVRYHVFLTEHEAVTIKPQIVEPIHSLPPRPSVNWFATISKALSGSTWTSDEEWNDHTYEVYQAYFKETEKASENNAFNNAMKGLNERGERLGILNNKLANVAARSEDFLNQIRQYNRQQEQKKWYQW